MRLPIVILLCGALSGTAAAADLDRLHRAITGADTPAMTEVVEALYVQAGASLNDRLVWKLQPFTHTYNYFAWVEQEIHLGSIPAEAEVSAYWDNWSEVLTGGRWNREEFFASDTEARDLAGFNQFVLGVHEMGHAVTYRYDEEHLARHDYSINCREYYADRLTAAFIEDVADADPRLAALRTRYVALMASMNAAIAENDRYHIESFEALDANCAIIKVDQPTPESLQPYASAYFERQRLLFSTDMPPAAELVATHLLARQADFMSQMPYGDEAARLELVRLGTIETFAPVSRYEQGEDYFAAGFALDGTLYLGQLLTDEEAETVSFFFGRPGALEPVSLDGPYGRDVNNLDLINIAPISADEVYALAKEDRTDHIVLWRAQRKEEGWSFDVIALLDSATDGRVLHTAEGRLMLMVNPVDPEAMFSPRWFGLAFDPAKDEVTQGPVFEQIYGDPMALRTDGWMLTYGRNLLFDFNTDAGFSVLAGNSLTGSKVGTDLTRTEFNALSAVQELPDGRIRLLDQAPDMASGIILELRPKAQAQ